MKKVKALIESTVQELDGAGICESSDKSSITTEAFLDTKGSLVRLSYEENGENGATSTEIIVNGDKVIVRRKGALESEFVFREGESHTSVYRIVPYSFDARIQTKRIRGTITADGGEMTLLYDMTVGGADKRIKMKIRVEL